MTKQEFLNAWGPYAQLASEKLNIKPSVILAQWAYESAWGTSDLSIRSGNMGGIKHTANSIDYGSTGALGYADYKMDKSKFVADYVRVLSYNAHGYDKVRANGSWLDQAVWLGRSDYAESHYNDSKQGVGYDLVQMIQANNLTQFDTGAAASTTGYTLQVPSNALSDPKLLALAILGVGVAMVAALR